MLKYFRKRDDYMKKVLITGAAKGIGRELVKVFHNNNYEVIICNTENSKDLYFGTKYITVSDLCDKELIYPEMFGLICNAMGIKRFGIKAIKNERGETN